MPQSYQREQQADIEVAFSWCVQSCAILTVIPVPSAWFGSSLMPGAYPVDTWIMDGTEIQDQVVGVIARTFGLPNGQNPQALRMGAISQWDSLGHMRLVPDLEKQFRVRFPVYMIAELVDVDSIVRAIQKLRAAEPVSR